MYILQSSNLSFQYTKGTNLVFPDLEIKAHQHTLVLGDSGSGKTTLLHLLSGLSKPSSGVVQLVEQNLYQLKAGALDAFRAKNMGFIFQEAHLLQNLTVLENIKLAQSLAKFPVQEEAIYAVLTQLQLQDKANSLPKELSRGQRQRTAIARALINKPALLIADEPTASLDDNNTQRVLDLLLQMADTHGSTLLIATHDKRIKDQFTNFYQL